MKISKIIYSDEYIFSEIDMEREFRELTSNINDIRENTLLLLTSSCQEFILQANHPLAIICDINADIPKEIPTIRVHNIRRTCAFAYFRYYSPDLSKIKVIGITGTNGKSSTALITKHILTQYGHKVGLIGTGLIQIGEENIQGKNYSMTTPDPSLLYYIMKKMEEKGCDIIVMEVSSHALKLDKVAPIRFDYGIFTNLSAEHMDFHKDINDYQASKEKLFSNCACAIINIDDKYGRQIFDRCESKKIGVGILWREDVWAGSLENNGLNGISYIYNQKNFYFKVNLKLAGNYNAYNSMIAAALCIDMKCKPCLVKDALESITELPGRFNIIKDKITVIIDYAHTYVAFQSILKNLSEIKKDKCLTVIFGCGGSRDSDKRPKMAEAAEKYADKIIITNDNPRNEDPKDIICDIIRGFNETSFYVNENRAKAIEDAIFASNNGEIIAIIGKGCEKYTIDKDGYSDFDEESIVKSALLKRNTDYENKT